MEKKVKLINTFGQEKTSSELPEYLYNIISQNNNGVVKKNNLQMLLELSGFSPEEPTWKAVYKYLEKKTNLSIQDISNLLDIQPQLIRKAITKDLIIPDFPVFVEKVQDIFDSLKDESSGNVATYIPQLAKADPSHFGVSICSIDGQQCHFGDCNIPFSVQSVTKTINYCLAIEEHGNQFVHSYVGKEPSGRGFNEFVLNNDGLPHNPMTNTGAITIVSLLKNSMILPDRNEFIMDQWRRFAGNHRLGFNTAVYLSERDTGDGNFAIAYMLKQKKLFPPETDLLDTLRLYFQCCSIEATTETLSIVGATLANGGVCPMTNERVISLPTSINCLSLMFSCGMYDFSGEFAFTTGVPAKSGVSGCMIVIIPNVCGISIYSPPLDKMGNPVRGIKFCESFVNAFNFHVFSNIMKN